MTPASGAADLSRKRGSASATDSGRLHFVHGRSETCAEFLWGAGVALF